MSNKRIHCYFLLTFFIYCAVMIWLLFFKDRIGIPVHSYLDTLKNRINLIPFKTVAQYLKMMSVPSNFTHAVVNLLGNILVFVPLGVFLPILWQKLNTFWNCFICGAIIITIIELTQLFTLRGSCDIDDFLLNLTGSAIGYALYKLFLHFTKGTFKL